MFIEPIVDGLCGCLRQLTRSCIFDLFHDGAWRFSLLATHEPRRKNQNRNRHPCSFHVVSPAESVFFLIGEERLRSKQTLQSRVMRLFLLNLLPLICLFTL